MMDKSLIIGSGWFYDYTKNRWLFNIQEFSMTIIKNKITVLFSCKFVYFIFPYKNMDKHNKADT